MSPPEDVALDDAVNHQSPARANDVSVDRTLNIYRLAGHRQRLIDRFLRADPDHAPATRFHRRRRPRRAHHQQEAGQHRQRHGVARREVAQQGDDDRAQHQHSNHGDHGVEHGRTLPEPSRTHC